MVQAETESGDRRRFTIPLAEGSGEISSLLLFPGRRRGIGLKLSLAEKPVLLTYASGVRDTLDELPDPVKLDVGFAQYESKSEFSGSVLRYTREYTVKQLELPVSDEPQLRRLFSTIYSDERNSAVLKKATGGGL